MALYHNILIDPPLPLLEYYTLCFIHDIKYKMTHVSYLTCYSHVNYVTLLYFFYPIVQIPRFLFIDMLIALKASIK